MQKITAASMRNWLRYIRDEPPRSAAGAAVGSTGGAPSVAPGQDDGADEGGEQEHGDRLERDEVGGEDRVGDLVGGLHHVRAGEVELDVGEGLVEHEAHDPGQQRGDGAADDPLFGAAVVELP